VLIALPAAGGIPPPFTVLTQAAQAACLIQTFSSRH